MVMWERPAGPAGGNGGCAGQVMYDGRHEPKGYIRTQRSHRAFAMLQYFGERLSCRNT